MGRREAKSLRPRQGSGTSARLRTNGLLSGDNLSQLSMTNAVPCTGMRQTFTTHGVPNIQECG